MPTLKGTEASLSYIFLVSCVFFNKCLYFSYYMAGCFPDRPRMSFSDLMLVEACKTGLFFPLAC